MVAEGKDAVCQSHLQPLPHVIQARHPTLIFFIYEIIEIGIQCSGRNKIRTNIGAPCLGAACHRSRRLRQ